MAAADKAAHEVIRKRRHQTERCLLDLEHFLAQVIVANEAGPMPATVGGPIKPGHACARAPIPGSGSELRYRAWLVALVMVLEAELKNYTVLLEKFHSAPAGVELTGSVLNRFKLRLTQRYGFRHLVRRQIWRDLRGLYQIRTSLLHDAGQLENLSPRKRSLVAAFCAQHGTPRVNGDTLAIDRATCQVGLALVRQFLCEIYEEAERLYAPEA